MAFYISALQKCPYLPDQEELLVLSDPREMVGNVQYGQLLQKGFRRNGSVAYRPMCPQCDACISVRIPVAEFQPDRGQRRTWGRNQGIQIREQAPQWDAAHARLFAEYQCWRHPGGGMDEHADRLYREMIVETGGVDARLLVFEQDDHPLAVALVDVLDGGVSAVYTFYTPDLPQRGLGIFAILSQIEWTRKQRLPYLYLGYWVASSPKMDYKKRFRPLEGFVAGDWRLLSAARNRE
ncbi:MULTISPECIES: arginyltransferase [Acidithiobacillus]|uniref:arginyltransferase n=1 Tax=Acidithiobacillus TaxID=119977 RepID=UPI001C077671|nr:MULTISPECIES: arginyltransferase [Acidithiobacillus]MBU2847175.1 arginyltransferase [Acidithiobacillus ferriphilus]MDA8245566.1 arginyltransferase [Acidithiobacillus sp.]MEB8537102.1 arginyltransferase [Acidithiobacillus ferriphilus]